MAYQPDTLYQIDEEKYLMEKEGKRKPPELIFPEKPELTSDQVSDKWNLKSWVNNYSSFKLPYLTCQQHNFGSFSIDLIDEFYFNGGIKNKYSGNVDIAYPEFFKDVIGCWNSDQNDGGSHDLSYIRRKFDPNSNIIPANGTVQYLPKYKDYFFNDASAIACTPYDVHNKMILQNANFGYGSIRRVATKIRGKSGFDSYGSYKTDCEDINIKYYFKDHSTNTETLLLDFNTGAMTSLMNAGFATITLGLLFRESNTYLGSLIETAFGMRPGYGEPELGPGGKPKWTQELINQHDKTANDQVLNMVKTISNNYGSFCTRVVTRKADGTMTMCYENMNVGQIIEPYRPPCSQYEHGDVNMNLRSKTKQPINTSSIQIDVCLFSYTIYIDGYRIRPVANRPEMMYD